jgi:hypothetical protein
VDELARGFDLPKTSWKRLTQILSCDVRQDSPIAVLGTTSEYRFYALASDFPQQLFFTFDIRDLGVDLMLFYELANKKVVDDQLTDEALLAETLLSSDRTIERKRATYDQVRAVFAKYHGRGVDARAVSAAAQAMGTSPDHSGPMPPFDQSIQLMAGGDEIFVAAHPYYTEHIGEILQDLDLLAFEEQPLNLRAGVAFSSADLASMARRDIGPATSADQRKNNQVAHDQALTLSSNAPNKLKEFERAQRRMERLIQKLADSRDKKKNDLVPGYEKKLDELRLLKLYARMNYAHAKVRSRADYARVLKALRDESVAAEADDGAELVDFNGTEVDRKQLRARVQTLEDALLKDAKRDNFHVDPPPVNKLPELPKWVPKWVLKIIDDIFPGLRVPENQDLDSIRIS